MKKLLVTLCVLIIPFSILLSVFGSDYLENITLNCSSDASLHEELFKEKQQAKENPNQIDNEYNRDQGLDEKKKASEELEQKLNEQDKKAYKIMYKYSNGEINYTNLITDKQVDYAFMNLILDYMDDNKISNDDIDVLKNYLVRRYSWIDDNEQLRNRIKLTLDVNY